MRNSWMEMILKLGNKRRNIRVKVMTVKYKREIEVDRIDLMNLSLKYLYIRVHRHFENLVKLKKLYIQKNKSTHKHIK